jgi:hypothetical protein
LDCLTAFGDVLARNEVKVHPVAFKTVPNALFFCSEARLSPEAFLER